MQAIILAGGLGTRLRSVVQAVPKPMAMVQGKPFLEHLLTYYQGQGVRQFILAVGYLAPMIRQHFGTQWQGCRIDYSEETSPLGTGGALLQASELLVDGPDDVCLALNGDTFFAINLAQLITFHRHHHAQVSIAAFRSADTQRYMSLAIDAHHQVHALNSPPGQQQAIVNGGAYLIQTRLLQDLRQQSVVKKQSWENDTLPNLVAAQTRVFAHLTAKPFIDIGIPSDYTHAQQFAFHCHHET